MSARAARPRRPTGSRTCWSTWPSRAPSGAAPATSPRRSRRLAVISTPTPRRETTAYYAKVMKEDVPLALDLLADILQHSTFDPEELERERAVVIQEIAQVNDTPDDLVFDRFQETAYPDQPIGRTILGPPELVGSYSRDALAAYMGAHYRAARMVLAGSGRIDHDALVAGGGGSLHHAAGRAGAGAGCCGLRRRRLPHRARPGAGAPAHRLRRPRLRRRRFLRAPGDVDAARWRHVVAALPGDPGAAGPRLLGLHLRLELRRRRHLRRLCRRRRGRARGADPGDGGRTGRAPAPRWATTRSPAPAPSSRPDC